MKQPLAWTRPVAVADLPSEGAAFELAPDEAVRTELARYAGVLALPALRARLTLIPSGKGGVLVEGDLEATVRQTCVVSLEAFDTNLRESIAVRFAPATAESVPGQLGEEDPPDPLVDGRLDLVAVVAEFLALAIDPYPRKPDAVFMPPAETNEIKDSPFAALAKLKGNREPKR
jgi:uncharacterized metal-binding protein YceD (DUF177 family)